MSCQIQFSDQGAQPTLQLSGEATIPHVQELKDAILCALETSQSLVLECHGLTDVDLSGLQLFCSAHRAAVAAGKTLTLEAEGVHMLGTILEHAGFWPRPGCAEAPKNQSCLWASLSANQ